MSLQIGPFEIIRPLPVFLLRKDHGERASLAAYKSGDLRITCRLYLPPEHPVISKSAHPIDRPAPAGGAMVVGHGGIGGVPDHYDLALRRLAIAGWTIAAPSFRGESGSDGEIEFASGESDDMLNCWKALSALPSVDPTKTWFLGSSHGSMAGMLALSKESVPAEIPGMIAGWGIYDVAAWLNWMEQIDHPILSDPLILSLLRMDESEIDRRSAINFADRIHVPILFLHGKSDSLSPFDQSIQMNKALIDCGNLKTSLHLEPAADHEFIWGPDRPEAITAWDAILNFMSSE